MAQSFSSSDTRKDPAFLTSDTIWVEKMMNKLSLDDKIGQLLMITAFTNQNEAYDEYLRETIKKYQVGGLILFKGGPIKQALLINEYQKLTNIPMFISIDAEWGLGMRLDSTLSYPFQMMLGAIQDDQLVYQMGYDIGRQLKRSGIHINYAPVADVNNNPANPVINYRSFGEDPFNVARKAEKYFKGLEDAGIISVAKHFPGHGDTNSDSHLTLPVISHDKARLDSVELLPFRYLINEGIPAIMSAHLSVSSLDSTKNRASSLSPLIIEELLKNKLGFKGLVITDALNMKGVSDYYKLGDIEVAALIAGNDILLMPSNVPNAVSEIKKEIRRGIISEDEIDKRCRKILYAKAWAGLSNYQPVRIDSLVDHINAPEYKVLLRKLIAGSLTVIKNRDQVLPLFKLEDCEVVSISVGTGLEDIFAQTLKLYTKTDAFYISKLASNAEFDSLKNKISKHNTLIISIQETSLSPMARYGITENTIKFINDLKFPGKIILVIFGNPYLLDYFDELNNIDGIIVAYNDEQDTKEITAQLVFGAIQANGKLPVSIKPFYNSGTGFNLESINRFCYGLPEEEGLNSQVLQRIDSLVDIAIKEKAVPGCQILVARNSKVIYHKAFGYHTYRNEVKVKTDDLYDLASITKITATIPMVMRLCDENRFDVNRTLSYYLPELEKSNKGNLRLDEILAHQAGLQPWIPFYYKTLEPLNPGEVLIDNKMSDKYPYKLGPNAYINRNTRYVDSVYSTRFSSEYPICVAKNLYLRKDFRDTIYQSIINSPLLERKQYLYSDLGYYFIHPIVEKISGMSIYSYLYENFYLKLGATTLGYLPLNRFPENRIVPTENDIFFRRQLIRGYVHDPGAAMLGGIAGHAGLFSSANDLGKMMQMLLNGGVYGGRIFLSDTIIQKFTSRAFFKNGNRRGLGFDKPEPDPDKISPASKSASAISYGHSGFTGSLVWIDPQYQLIYIFLSNRIHPDQYNTKLIDMNIRTQIQDVIYQSLDEKITGYGKGY